jgi:hypothetical protein
MSAMPTPNPKKPQKKTLIFCSINKDLKRKLKSSVPLFNDRTMGHVIYEPTESKIVKDNISKGSYQKKFLSAHSRNNIAIYKRPEKPAHTRTLLSHLRSTTKNAMGSPEPAQLDTGVFPIWWKPYIGTASIQPYNKERDAEVQGDTNIFFNSKNYFRGRVNGRGSSGYLKGYSGWNGGTSDDSLTIVGGDEERGGNEGMYNHFAGRKKFGFRIKDMRRIEDIAKGGRGVPQMDLEIEVLNNKYVTGGGSEM